MSVHDERRHDPVSFEATARYWVTLLEDHHSKASGHPLPIARALVARKSGIAPGTLENIRRGRLKEIRRRTAERLRAFMTQHLKSEIQRLEYELMLARQRGAGLSESEIGQASIALEEARAILKRGGHD